MLTAQQLVENAKKHITELNVTQTAKQLNQTEPYQIIDVREPDEFVQGHLPNAHNIPRGVLEFKIEEAVSNKSTPIVVYCQTGGRAALSAHALQTLLEFAAAIAAKHRMRMAIDQPRRDPAAVAVMHIKRIEPSRRIGDRAGIDDAAIERRDQRILDRRRAGARQQAGLGPDAVDKHGGT